MTRCIGLYREKSHSPGRVDDDAAIMGAVRTALGRHGLAVDLLDPDPRRPLPVGDGLGIFAMCEQEAMLDRLARAEQAGVPVVNRPAAIRNTYRSRTATLFARADVPAPPTWLVDTDGSQPAPAPRLWIKRADFHATQSSDVQYVDGPAAWAGTLARFAARGLARAVVQAHVPGDLVKFYGVEGGADRPGWFHWFYHADQQLAGHAFAEARLRGAAFAGARALDVEIFGGDAIVDPDGRVWVIDLNAWPSFARCRDEAAGAIAARLADRFAAAPACTSVPRSLKQGTA